MRSLYLLALSTLTIYSAYGISLRDVIQNDLKASNSEEISSSGQATKRKCKDENPKTVETMCERADHSWNGVAECKCCTQTCRIWGDPHLKSFVESGSISVFTKPGIYTLYNVNEKKDQFNVTVEAEKVNNLMWIRKAWLNSKLELDAGMCKNQGSKKAPFRVENEVTLKGDKGDNIVIRYFFACRFKYDTWALDISIEVEDCGAKSTDIKKLKEPFNRFPYANSTTFWASDYGACVDALTYGLPDNAPYSEDAYTNKNKHPYKINENRQGPNDSDVATKGRVCRCKAQCALWGDPHVLGFNAKKSEKAMGFLMPKAEGRTAAQRVIYSSQNKFAVLVDMDDCEFITSVSTYILKPDVRDKLERDCVDPYSEKWLKKLTRDSYQKFTRKADELCKDDTQVQGDDRKTITLPNSNDNTKKYYSSKYDGYALGQSALTADNLLYPIKKEENVGKCAITKNGKTLKLVDLGSVRVIMKCHTAVGGYPYFNVCVEREGYEQADWDKTVKGTVASSGDLSVMDMEQWGATGGWCATGDYKNQKNKNQIGAASEIKNNAFTYREKGETQVFELVRDEKPDNTQ